MRTYRFYRLDGANRIDVAEWLDAEDDEDACRKANELCPSGRYEVWERGRLIECVDRDAA